MKAKFTFYTLFLVMLLSSCDYLDIVPDETVTEESTYQNELEAKRFLYSCYGTIPRRNSTDNNIEWRGRGMEFLIWEAAFTNIAYNPVDVANNSAGPGVIIGYTWSPVWEGIRRCYKFLDVVDKVPNISAENLKYFKAEATFLIGYLHFISLQNYGPTCIVRREYNSNDPSSSFPERSAYDEVVKFIDEKLEEAYPNLADFHSGQDYGRATKSSVWAIRSRMYLYAASKLFNGNSMYADLKSAIDGRNLISQTFDPDKWKISAEKSRLAIEAVERLGYHLYEDAEAGSPSEQKPGLPNMAQRRVKYSFMDVNNTMEVLWAETRGETIYDMQNRSIPRWKAGTNQPAGAVNGISLTLQMVEKFYTKNGLPMEVDKDFDCVHRYDVVDMPVNYDGNNYSNTSNGKTMSMHLNREPRFYAWVGFHNGFAEVAKHNNAVTSIDASKKVIVLKLRKDDEQGKGTRTNHYSYTGYLSKKFVHPANQGTFVRYPFPIFRLAEMYLNYAESLIEVGGEDNLNLAKKYIDKIRTRAGILPLDEAWNDHSNNPGYQNTQKGLREIVRREREIELHLEGNHFWDSRRWMITEDELSVDNPHKILNVDGVTDETFFQIKNSTFIMGFNKAQYLMPISASECNKAPQIIQNLFY